MGAKTKRRKYLNYFHITRLRLQDLEDEDGTEGVNQHAVIERLRATVRDLRAARAVLEQLTRDQGGQQLLSAHGGLDQAEAAVEHACGEAHNGEFDWMAPGWGAAVCYLIGDAEDLVEEEEGLNLVHPADVLAMAEGAEGATSRPGGTWQQQCQRLLRDVRAVAVMHMQGEPAVMDMLLWSWTTSCYAPSRWTHKTTEEGEPHLEGPLFGPAPPRQPPLGMEQWPGSIPSTDAGDNSQGGPAEPSQWGPTDAELVEALEECERQQEEEARAAAAAVDRMQPGGDPPEEDLSLSEMSPASHRRRRMHATVYDRHGGFHPPGESL